MTATLELTKPSVNGVIKLNRRGLAKFQFGDDEPIFEVDVIAVYDSWYEIEWQLRDADGVLPVAKWNEHGQNRLNFVQAVVNDAYGPTGKGAPTLTRGEAESFIAAITEEAAKLRNFTKPKTEEKPSSPESTEIRFSQ